jgi:hypothetical protein
MALNTEKYINVYYNKGDRKPYDVNGKPIAYLGQDYVGANEATIIRFNIGDDTGVVEGVADVKRPDGEKAFLIMTKVTIGTDVFYELPLTDWHTAKVGKLVIAFKAFDGAITVVDGEIQANSLRVIVSDIFNIDIGYSPNSIQETPPFDPNDLSAIIAALSSKLDKVNGINVVQALPTPIDNSLNGRWYLVKSGSPESIGKLFVFNDDTPVEVELGTGQFNFSTTGLTTDALTAGQVRYNDTTGSLDLGLKGNHVLKVGEVLVKRVRNDDASSLKVGQLVYVFGSVGNSGLLLVKKASNVGESTSSKTFGMVATAMNTTSAKDGYVYLYGLLQGIDLTDTDITNDTFVSGDVGKQLWLGENGKITKTLPTADNKHSVFVGYLDSFAGAGSNCSIYTKIQNGYEIGELHDVRISAVADNQILRYNSTRQVWENTSELTTAESDIDALEGRMTTEEGNVDNLQGRMTTAETDITNIENGTTIVPKANADKDNNEFDATYLKKASASATYIPLSQKGQANGVVPLGSNGKVPSIYLSGEQDDIQEFDTLEDFPLVGEADILYVAKDTNKLYRWSGSAYVVISETLALGTTNTTAFPGDRGLALETLTDNIVDGDQALALKNQVIRNTVVGTSPLVVNSIASTTANLTEFQVNGTKVLEVTPAGGLAQNGVKFLHSIGGNVNSNIALGYQALNVNSTGSNNVAVGFRSLVSNNNVYSTGIGWGSLESSTGQSNTALGNSSGRNITTGNQNTFIGMSSGETGAWGTQLATASNSTAIGNQSTTDKSNQMVFGNASVTEFKFDRNTGAVALLPQIISTSPNATFLNRTSSVTNEFRGHVLTHTTSGDMSDGFGTLISFSVRDNANVLNEIAFVGALRSGADNSGRLVFQTATTATLTEKMTILPNGRVGIGTTTPDQLLHVAGQINLHSNLTWFNGNSDINGADANIKFRTFNGTALTEYMRITSAGNVGIGTTTPQDRLSVSGSLTNLTSEISIINTDGSPGGKTTLRTGIFGLLNSGLSILTANADGSSEVARMVIRADGNVGIGTTTPSNKLESVDSSATTFNGLGIYNTLPYGGANFSDKAESILNLGKIEGSARQPMGAIGASPTSNGSSNDGYLSLYTRSSGALSERIRIITTGLVGINETAPTAQLQVKSGATTRVPLIVDTISGFDQALGLEEFRVNTSVVARINGFGSFATLGSIFNLTNINNANITPASTGTSITRNVADTNPALIVNLSNASATGNIQVWQKAGSAKLAVNGDGHLINSTSSANIAVQLLTSGLLVERDTTTSGVVLTVNQNQVTSTGNIQNWNFDNGNVAYVDVDGDFYNASGSYGQISDLRVKENIIEARDYTEDLMKLRVVKYSLKKDQEQQPTKLGFIAQEFEEVFPNMVQTTKTEELEDMKSIKMSVLIPMLVKTIQEQQKQINELIKKIG